MKNKSIIIVLLSVPVLTFGQVTIKSAEDFSIGTVLKFQNCDTNGIKPGFTGPKQTWDFSTLKADGGTTTETIVAPETTPNGKFFAKSNTVEKYSDGSYVYIDKGAQTSSLIGYVNNSMTMSYSKPMVVAKRPVNFGGSNPYTFTEKYTVNNMNFSGGGTVIIAADGYGTLILPDKKKYSDVLRIKITEKQKDTLLQYKSVSLTTTVTYVWFDDKHKSALLKISSTKSQAYNNESVEYLLSEEDK